MSEKDRFTGIITALITPFTQDGAVDEDALRVLIDDQIEGGVNGIAVVAGSGEFVNLSPQERLRVVDVSVEAAAGRVAVIGGVLAPDTREAVACSKAACQAGADAVLVLTPFYNKPSRDGLYGHFKAVSDAIDKPVILYNNPGRTGINMDLQDYVVLAGDANVVGVKECNRDLADFSRLLAELGDKWSVLSGEDDLLYPSFALGAPGGIITTGNIAPKTWTAMARAVAEGDQAKAKAIHYAVLPLIQAVYTLNHPALVKCAVRTRGLPAGHTRAPLADPTPEQVERIKAVLKDLP
jgi:4-hydroxy-tetrahydrodipicolinate synthase